MSPFQRFMAELRRRHVPQTAAVYAVAAWAAIQFADVVAPNLGWPPWVVPAVIIAAAIGFPVVIALSWLLEWGPEGIHRTPPEEGSGDAAAAAPARGRPVEPRGSYAPWATALGVLAVGISAALVVAALRTGSGDAGGDEPDPDRPQTRFERRQGLEGGAPRPPIPPALVSPGFADSLARSTADSVLRALDEEGLGRLDIGALTEMAQRIGESAGRFATGGPVEILEPETWRYGAPQPVHPGDTLRIRGIVRAEQGVTAVEVDGRVVARDLAAPAELPFEAAIVAGGREGRAGMTGFRRVRLVVRVEGGDSLARGFSYTIVPREGDEGDPDDQGAGGGTDGA
jgi:hypothetical protein